MKKVKVELAQLYKPYLAKYISLKEDQKKKLGSSFYVVLSLFTISFFGIFAINPTLSTITNLRKQYEDNKKVEKALREKIAALGTLSQQYRQISSSLALVDTVIPDAPRVPEFAAKIRKLTQDHKVIIGSVTFGSFDIYKKNIEGSDVLSLTFSLSVSGSESDIHNFVFDIINFDRLISVDSFTVGIGSQKESALSLNGKVFFKKD